MIIMIKKAKLDSYRMMNLWVDEVPDDCKGGKEDIACIYKANKDITWFSGILCLELKLAPRDASNYAKYIAWLVEESNTILDTNGLKHICIVSANSVIDVIAFEYPEIVKN